MPLLLEGNVDERDGTIAALEQEVERLEGDLGIARAEVAHLRKENARAVSALRRQLSPLHQALRQVFGEMDALGTDEPGSPDGKTDKWNVIKQRLTPRLREAVDILQLQGTMRRTQLATALKMDYSNCTKNVIGVLIRQGWVVDNGGNLSLKEL